MRIVTRKHLPRRTFLRGMMGATVALPLLDAMVPALTAQTKTAAAARTRLSFIYVPHGAMMKSWTPAGEGADFEFSSSLKPLEPFRKNLLILSGMANTAAEAHGDGGGDHARSAPSFLSGVHPIKTEDEIRAGATVDQIAAQRIGQDTPLPSLELGIEDTGLMGICDGGYSCAYMNSIAWSSPTQPLPMEINPRIVFERVFGDGSSAAQRLALRRTEGSILDSITQEVRDLQGGLGPRDKAKVGEYLENVREIERRIQKAEKQSQTELAAPDTPIGVPEGYDEHVKLMFDLQVLSFQAEITRISTFMLARDLSARAFPTINVPDGFHGLSHHGNDPAKIAKLARINNYHAQLFAYYLERLNAIPDGDGTLLDHSMILYGSSMSNPNAHDHAPLPLLLAGGASGQLKGGRHLKVADRTPQSNLLVAMMSKAGIELDKVGDSTGKLEI